ncbi:MAG: alanine racemase [Oscillospiraceae bacterium]|nr:alanine racemase [Oscillospiraceae bacterium]
MKKYLRRAWAEIHLDRLENNINEIKTLVKNPSTEIAGVVKANAYGHDDRHIAPFLEKHGINFLAVSNIKEAEKLRDCGCKGDILILGYTPPEYADELSDYNIIQTAVSYVHAKGISENAKKPVRIHIAVDTGMGRIGLDAEDITVCADEFEKIASLPNIRAEGAFTHYAVADSYAPDNIEYTKNQTEKFFALSDELKKRGIRPKHFHCLNSAGGTFHFDERSTIARFGIMLYGLKPDNMLDMPVKLLPVMDLKAAVSYVKPVKAGSFISYGRTYCAEKDILAATVPIGYADGYSRLLSGKASVIVNGKKAPVIGRVCMDQLMIDVTGIPDVHEGTEVLLFGMSGDIVQTADELAQLYGTIGYEIICGISKRIPRVIMYNGEINDVVEYY